MSQDHAVGLPLLLNTQPQGDPLSLHTASVPPGHLGGAQRFPGTRGGWGSGRGGWPGRGPLGPEEEESLRDPRSGRRRRWKWWGQGHVPGRRPWQLHVHCALSSFHWHLLIPRSPHAGPLLPTYPASDHTWWERLAVRGLAGGSPHAWLQPFSPGPLPSLSPLTHFGPDPHLLLCPFPLVFHRYVPSKSLAWFIPGILGSASQRTQTDTEPLGGQGQGNVCSSCPHVCPFHLPMRSRRSPNV